MTEPIFAPHLSRWKRAGLALAVWTVLGLIQTVRLYIIYNAGTSLTMTWSLSLVWALADWYIWGGLSILIFAIVRRVQWDRWPWYRVLAVHIPAAIVFSGGQLALYAVASEVLATVAFAEVNAAPEAWYTSLYYLTLNRWHSVLLTYVMIAAIGYAWQFYNHKRQEETRRLDVERQLAQAQLSALKARLQPHFLFNTLNAVTALIHSDPHQADRMVSRLSDLLRLVVDSDGQTETTLHHELDFVERYLDIQRLRFPDRLRVDYAVDPFCRDAVVPNLILQPIVENAVQYAVAARKQGGQVSIAAERSGDNLNITITDDGPGLPKTFDLTVSDGVGLTSTKGRLERMYAGRGTVRLRNRESGGLEVTMIMPFRTDGNEANL
jgi:signal transduction histidine kinase